MTVARTRTGKPREGQIYVEAAPEAVAGSADGLNEGVVLAGLQRLAQPADMHVHRALLDEDVVAPDFVEQLRRGCRRAPDGS